ncbi:TPA: hypothetical protein ACGOZ1_000318 [Streptococcus suis]
MKDDLYNKYCVIFFYVSLIIFPLNKVVSLFFQGFGFPYLAGKSIYIGYFLVYLLAFTLIIRFGVSLKRLTVLYTIYILYFILFLTSNSAVKPIFTDVKMLMNFFYYLPYSVLILSTISDFDYLFSSKIINNLNYLIIISSFIVKYSFNEQSNYMTYSYHLLPIWILFTINYIYKPGILKTVIAIIMILEGVLYGARGPLIWLFASSIFFILLKVIEDKFFNNITLKSISRFFLGSMLLFGIFNFMGKLFPTLNINDSYILRRIQDGEISDSLGRVMMFDIAISYLKNMGGEINGIFFDRTLMPSNLYVHNFILETFLSFGWVLGFVILFSIFYLLLSTFLKAKLSNKKLIVFAISAFFLKYFLSGSLYEDDGFIILLSLIYSVKQQEEKQPNY